MADVFTKAKRSEVMSRIRSRGNAATEVALAKLLRRHGITGWRRHVKIVTQDKWQGTSKRRISPRSSPQRGDGAAQAAASTPVTRLRSLSVRPDFVFRASRLAVFVDGCFWHGCPRHATQPKDNRAFWTNKFAHNQARDRLVTRTLRATNWRVLRIWEHSLRWAAKTPRSETRLVRRIQRWL